MQFRPFLIRHARWTFFSIISGLLSGVAATIFLNLLDWATNFREENMIIIWALPLAGFFIGWVYHVYGKDIAGGYNLILDEIADPKKVVSIKMAPFILVGTVITHLFGGSAGREGTAVQMGSSLSDQISRFFRVSAEERKILLTTGAGAGFGAAIGAPWAGVVFGMEVIQVGRLRLFAWFECLVASFVGYWTTHFLGAHHSHYPSIIIPEVNFKIILYIALAGILFGFSSKLFTMTTHLIEQTQKRFVSYPPLKPMIGGLILVVLYYLDGTYRYVGLGIPYIQDALTQIVTFKEPVLKGFFTAITVGSGFKGGEFIPLVFIGTTLGSALSMLIPVSSQLLAGVGFAAVFAGASNTPIACSIMAIEMFGIEIAPYAIVACFMSYYFSGHRGIYQGQRIYKRKYQRLLELCRFKRS